MKIGIIGGSGLYDLEGLTNVQESVVSTPFGDPSDAYVCGTFGDREVAFLPRHGKGHRLLPSEINHRANIFGFKTLGVSCVLSVSAVGSLREELRPRDVVLPDQYFDRTKRPMDHTFFGQGIVAHVAFGEPCCPALRETIAAVTRDVLAADDTSTSQLHDRGTYVNMEGPAFSTKAESHFYRAQGFDVIGMTSLAEAKLCREAELCYQGLAMVTDYDCWNESEEDVTVEMVVAHLMANTALAKRILQQAIPAIETDRACTCGQALSTALLTQKDAVAPEAIERLGPIVSKYL